MPLSKLSDEELLRLLAAGDENALTTLYRRRQGAIYRFALQMSGCPAVAEDVTQEVFIRMMCDPQSYDPSRGSVAAYLYGIARNQVLRRLRRDQNHVQIDDEEETVHESLIAESDPLGDLTRGEAIESLRQAVLALPEHYREAVVLCDLHEMSYQESASALGCSVGTIRSRLHRGRALLAAKLRSSRAGISEAADEKRCLTWNAKTLKA
ncbi:MAG: RNA polymerase sigma factor [Acidobacteriota bacterium]